MAATTIAAMKKKADNSGLVRKTTNACAFLAPTSATLPETITETTGQLSEAPAGFWPIGLVTTDGFEFSNDTDKSEVEALGYADPVRTDITKVAKSVKVTAFETWKKNLLEVIKGVDLSQVKSKTGSGEVTFDEPQTPILREYRMLIIATDGPADAEFIWGKGFPRVKLAELPGETWNQEDAVSVELTFDILPDAELGMAVRNYYGGSGAKKYKDQIGFDAQA